MHLELGHAPVVEHLNPFGLIIGTSEVKGRGVYATREIPSGTLIEKSPALIFEKKEYDDYAKHTIVDHYTFAWRDGRMALALGIGSIFNHSSSRPNVSYTLDRANSVINFTTMRAIGVGDELCIYYGPNLWFASHDVASAETVCHNTGGASDGQGLDNTWCELPAMTMEQSQSEVTPDGDEFQGSALILKGELPLERLKFPDEEQAESDVLPVPTIEVWAVDIYNLGKVSAIIDYLRTNAEEFDTESLRHLKRIRRSGDPETAVTSLALATASKYSLAPTLPPEFASVCSPPYIVSVPATAAFNSTQLSRKTLIWPVAFYPTQDVIKKEKEWTRHEIRWVKRGLRTAIEAAQQAKKDKELPIAAFVPPAYGAEYPQEYSATSLDGGTSSWLDIDTRSSSSHPLRHACLNLIRSVAESQSAVSASIVSPVAKPRVAISSGPRPLSESPMVPTPSYLLSSLSLFVTHEPCIMCTMALLHSRVKEVFYIFPMHLTGGCGGLVKESVPGLRGTNHKFTIWRWSGDLKGLGLSDCGHPDTDAGLGISPATDI